MNKWDVKVVAEVEKTYLWGGEEVNIEYPELNMFLHFRVPDDGEEILFGHRNKTSSSFKTLGQLKPGESCTVPLKELRGVFARCVDSHSDTRVECSLVVPMSN